MVALNKDIRISIFALMVSTRLPRALRHCRTRAHTEDKTAVSYNLQTDHPKKYEPHKYDKTLPRGLCTVPCKFTISSVAYEPRKRTT